MPGAPITPGRLRQAYCSAALGQGRQGIAVDSASVGASGPLSWR